MQITSCERRLVKFKIFLPPKFILFNEQNGTPIAAIYGVITIGTIWQFLKLEQKTVSIDLSEYYISDIKKILGILFNAIACAM